MLLSNTVEHKRATNYTFRLCDTLSIMHEIKGKLKLDETGLKLLVTWFQNQNDETIDFQVLSLESGISPYAS